MAERTAAAEALSGVFRVGAELARVAAEAVTGQAQPPLRSDEAPLPQMMHYGSKAAGTFLALTVNAAREAGLGAGTATPAPVPPMPNPPTPRTASATSPPRTGPASIPELARGGTLRIPLSIDNQGGEPMVLHPQLDPITASDGAPAKGLKATFSPETLTIAPRDFEKLTVIFTAARNARPGDYRVRFRLGDDPLTISLRLT